MASKYRSMMVQLSPYIKDRELKSLKYYLGDTIAKRDMENIESAFDLWAALEQREQIGEKNLDFLKEMLNVCFPDRVDMRTIVENYERSESSIPMNVDVHQVVGMQGIKHMGFASFPTDYVGDYNGPPDMEPCIRYLTKKLGREWKFFVRNLQLAESDIEEAESYSPRSLREQIYCCLRKWLLKHQKLSEQEMLVILKKALKGFGRNDLVEDMEVRKYIN